jgi:gastric triacylglycerol lipase
MADYDLPAMFTYIYNFTHQKIHYVGHSQGTIQMHIALSKRNEVVEGLMDKYFGFGPVAYINHQESHIIGLLDKSLLLEWYKKKNIHEFMPGMSWFETSAGMLFCSDFAYVCADFLKYIADADPSLDNYDRYDVLIGHDPSGTSVQNMEHWKQLLDKKEFIAFDYGSAK